MKLEITAPIVVYSIIVLLAVIYYYKNKENFIDADNTEFRGINMLGVNSLDTHVSLPNAGECQNLCARNEGCKGYSFYEPAKRCYLFETGDFVFNRPGYISGKKY